MEAQMENGTNRSYQDLEAWREAMALAEMVYKATDSFPKNEQFGLTIQARRAAASIPANLAEGQGRQAHADFRRFVQISRGSLSELETHLLLAMRLGFLKREQLIPIWEKSQITGRLINGLIRSLSKRIAAKKSGYRLPATGYRSTPPSSSPAPADGSEPFHGAAAHFPA